MKTAGIIAEYNPFHHGHLYQLKQVREHIGADFIIIAMSGDFVQRGEPAIFDKYTRTRMALSCGADLVLEIPSISATSSAENFAYYGVSLLDQMGVVDFLCFGSELGELPPLQKAAKILWEEPETFKSRLRSCLRQGLSYPASTDEALRFCDMDLSGVLSSPNNILAIEYLKALRRRESKIVPVTIRRRGQGYHDTSLSVPPQIRDENTDFASASAIRRLIFEGSENHWKSELPAPALQALLEEQPKPCPISPNDLSALLNYRLLEALRNHDDLSRFADISPELAKRLIHSALDFSSFTGRTEHLKTRNYTYARVCRAMLHLLLNITSEDIRTLRELGGVPYARVLGFCRRAEPLLSTIKANASIPLITKTADAGSLLSPRIFSMLEKDFFSSHLYQSLSFQKGRPMKNEYTKSVMILP